MPALKHTSEHSGEESTETYYETHAPSYFEATRSIDMTELYDQFLPYVSKGGRILDAGSGSGRDTLAFLSKGYEVEAFEASPRLAEMSSRLTGIHTGVLRLQDFHSPPRFDGVWACASLLHVPQKELADVVMRLVDALKPGGVLFICMKEGAGERLASDGRLFTDWNEAAARALLEPLDVDIMRIWISPGQGPRRGQGDWLNVLAAKKQARGSR
jgi:SAM-dependent methyltransferase